MAKRQGFSMDTVKNPRKPIDLQRAQEFIRGADYAPGFSLDSPVEQTHTSPDKGAAEKVSENVQDAVSVLIGTESKTLVKGNNHEIAVAKYPWEECNPQKIRHITVQLDDISYNKLEYVIEHMSGRQSIRKFARETVLNRINEELDKLLKK